MEYNAGIRLALAMAVVILSSAGNAALIEVVPGESIQAAIDEAASGDRIVVRGGIYHESLNITKSIFIEGRDHSVIVSGADDSGISLRASGITVFGFYIRTMRRIGIHALSNDNIIINNSISGCMDGVRLENARNNSVAFNEMTDNANGITLHSSNNNIINKNNIMNNNIGEENDCGIFLVYSDGNVIRQNNLSDNGDASISLRSSSYNRLHENNVSLNDWHGISLSESSNNNLIVENTLDKNKDAGISLDSSRGNAILNNTATRNAKGIYLACDSNDNLLEGNTVSENKKGLCLAYHSSNNSVRDNTLLKNGYGIHLTFSAGWNLIVQNRLINNSVNAFDRGLNNRWDNGLVGNYYSDLGSVFYIPGGSGVDRHPMATE